jgi:hypothetical protein
MQAPAAPPVATENAHRLAGTNVPFGADLALSGHRKAIDAPMPQRAVLSWPRLCSSAAASAPRAGRPSALSPPSRHRRCSPLPSPPCPFLLSQSLFWPSLAWPSVAGFVPLPRVRLLPRSPSENERLMPAAVGFPEHHQHAATPRSYRCFISRHSGEARLPRWDQGRAPGTLPLIAAPTLS